MDNSIILFHHNKIYKEEYLLNLCKRIFIEKRDEMALKTLKEIEGMKIIRFDNQQCEDRELLESDLKEEAIKWIKELENEHRKFFYGGGGFLDITLWIKHFFNITEESIKKKYAVSALIGYESEIADKVNKKIMEELENKG